MSIFKDKKNVKWLLAFIFVIVLAALIFVIMSFSAERKRLDNELRLNSESKQEVVNNFLDDQEFLALAFSREEYLNANLTKLSPTKEVLGGNFFVTSVVWIDRDTAVINYEDGHIALSAKVGFLNGSTEVQYFDPIRLPNNELDNQEFFEN